MHRGKTSLTGSSASVRVENEGGAAAWLLGTLAVPSAQDMDCLHHKSFGAISVFFQASCCCRSEPLFGQSFSVALPVQESFLAWGPSVFRRVRHTKGPPLPGVLLCSSVHQAFVGAASLLFGYQCWRVGREWLW